MVQLTPPAPRRLPLPKQGGNCHGVYDIASAIESRNHSLHPVTVPPLVWGRLGGGVSLRITHLIPCAIDATARPTPQPRE